MKLAIKKKPVSYSYSPFVDGVSQSMLAQWFECQEKARLSIVLGLTESTPSKPLIFGDISHEVLDQYYTDMKSGEIKTHGQAVASTEFFVERAVEKWYKKHPRASSEAQEIVEESAGLITVLFPEYSAHWWDQDINLEWLAIETVFKVPIDIGGKALEAKPFLTGKVDGIVREKKTGVIRLFETKNKSQFSEILGLVLPLDLQVGTYLTAAPHLIKEPVNHATYNLIKRPGQRQGKKESRAEFLKRLRETVRANRKDFFERYKIKMDAEEIERHRFATELRVKAFVQWWQSIHAAGKEQRSYMWNGGACENKYGICKFIHGCASDDFSKFHVRPKAHAEL